MKEENHLLLAFFYLGGDVILALLANLSAFTFAFQYQIRRVDTFVLLLSVLGIYLLDRSYDALKERSDAKTRRGAFYLKKVSYTIPTGILALSLALVLALLTNETKFLLGGIFIGFLVGSYLIVHLFFPFSFFPKEILIALLYCLGVSYPVFFFRPLQTLTEVLVYAMFFLSILAEVILLSLEDFQWDRNYQQMTLVLAWGQKKSKQIFLCLLVMGLLLALYVSTLDGVQKKVGIGYAVYFSTIAFLPGFLNAYPSDVRKIILELSYLPFLVYYFL